ncbi:MAG TPA: autotransporter domain-containing protein [Sphingomicrobium sp.]|nr:autotransporter domain-containing protein [Sphingomicrobium sp.]
MLNNRLIAKSLFAATALVAFASPAAAQRVGRIVAFGDSYADDGNFFQLVGINPATTQVYTTGRFSGGTNYIDTLGSILGVPIDNFAIGGALTDNRNTNGPPLGFVTEYQSFLAGGGPAAFPRVSGRFNETDLLAISIGGNDARFYQRTGGTLAGAPGAAAVAVTNATTGLNALVGAGARTISFLAGDTGVLPEVNFTANPTSTAAIRTAFSNAFNQGIQAPLAGYAANGVMVHYLDLSKVLANISSDFGAYGLTALACPAFPAPAGPGVPGSAACATDSSNFLVYGDQLHLTSAGFAIVGRFVAAQLTAPLRLQATSNLALDTARQFGRTLSTRMDSGSPRDGDMPEGFGVYLVGDSVSRTVKTSRTNNQFSATSVGATLGAEFGFGAGLVGAAVNLSRPKADFRTDDARTKSKSLQVGVYGSAGIAGGFVQAYAGYGRDDHEIGRLGVVLKMEADADGSHTLAGVKAGYLMPMGAIRVGPVAALDYARAKVDSYSEQGDPALDLNVGASHFASMRGSIGGEVRGDFEGGGVQLRPFAAAVVEKDFKGDGRTFTFAQTSAPTIVNRFAVEEGSKKAYARISAGFSAAILPGVSLNAAASGTLGKDQGNETSAHVGFRAGF